MERVRERERKKNEDANKEAERMGACVDDAVKTKGIVMRREEKRQGKNLWSGYTKATGRG